MPEAAHCPGKRPEVVQVVPLVHVPSAATVHPASGGTDVPLGGAEAGVGARQVPLAQHCKAVPWRTGLAQPAHAFSTHLVLFLLAVMRASCHTLQSERRLMRRHGQRQVLARGMAQALLWGAFGAAF